VGVRCGEDGNGRGGAARGRAPGLFGEHQPVLLEETRELLAPGSGETIVDCTAGGGGHAAAFLDESEPDGRLLGIDWDDEALSPARARLAPYGERARLVRGNFADIRRLAAEEGFAPADVVFLDLGLSSFQIEDPARGFSFLRDGPLDMRMDRRRETTAREVLAERGEKELADILFAFGEEKAARKIARTVVEARRHGGLRTTGELAALVARVAHVRRRRGGGGGGGRIHPATRTFQALRIEVNREIENLMAFLEALPGLLAPGGKAGVVAFHSLEDRPVKRTFRKLARSGEFELLTRRVVRASDAERRANPRARSARLRVIRRAGACSGA